LSWIGRVVADRYRLMEVVGRGGHSLIYRGVERASGAEVAIKVLHHGIAQKDELEARMQREHDVLVSLAGSAAPRVHGVWYEDASMCLVMEYLRGQDLDEYLSDVEAQGHRVEIPTLVELLEPIVDTIEVAHDRGIVHRDLKPGNIFVLGRGGPGGVRLLDFGLAATESATPITQDGIVIGSPSYIAPEVWEGNPRALDLRVDVYSMGAIIFRALGGQVPFPVSSLREKLAAATGARRPSLRALRPDLPPGVDEWVEQALAIERNKRFSRVRGMWNALLATLNTRNRGRYHGIEAS
jgi:eukaryotic-like serine/threonine-protein kinase